MSVNKRIKKIREHYCGGNNQTFAEILGLSEQYTSNLTRSGSVGNKKIDEILEKFPDVNPVWLKVGEGEMLKTNIKINNKQGEKSINMGGGHICGNVNIGDNFGSEINTKEDAVKLLARMSLEYNANLEERFAYIQQKEEELKRKRFIIDGLMKENQEQRKIIDKLINKVDKLTDKLIE